MCFIRAVKAKFFTVNLKMAKLGEDGESCMGEANITSSKISSIVRDKTADSEKIASIREKLDLIELEIGACRKILRGEKVE